MQKENDPASASIVSSMTGLGRARVSRNEAAVLVTIRSVNHRGLDIKCRMPEELAFFEAGCISRISHTLSRGRIDVDVHLETKVQGKTLTLDEARLHPVLSEISRLNEHFPALKLHVGYSELLAMSGVRLEKPSFDEHEIQTLMNDALGQALQDLMSSRAHEGALLGGLVTQMLNEASACMDFIAARMNTDIKTRFLSYKTRAHELFSDVSISEDRLYQELALLCERSDFKEEIDRLYAHVDHFFAIVRGAGHKGRKLDFLCQEMLRESTTLLSKASAHEVMVQAIDLKALVERIREQVQNIE